MTRAGYRNGMPATQLRSAGPALPAGLRNRFGAARWPVAVFAGSASAWLAFTLADRVRYWQQTDAAIYRDGGLAVLHGAALYPTRFGPAALPFTYPPFAGLLFAGPAPLPFMAWQAGLALAGLIALVVSTGAAVVLAGRPVAACGTPALAVAAVALWLEPVQTTLSFGQLNLVLMAVVLVDLVAVTRESPPRLGGVGIGLAAAVKLTPLVFVAYLVLTGRVRAARTAVLTLLATVALGAAALPSDAWRYWSGLVTQPGDEPFRLVNQSVYGGLLRLGHSSGSASLPWAFLALAAGAVGLTGAVLAARRATHLLAACLAGVTGLLVSPVSWTHHWAWVVPVLVLAGTAPARWRTAAVGTVIVLFAWWPLRAGIHGGWDPTTSWHPSGWLRLVPHDDARELHERAGQLLVGDYYVLAGLAFLLIATGVLLVRRNDR